MLVGGYYKIHNASVKDIFRAWDRIVVIRKHRHSFSFHVDHGHGFASRAEAIVRCVFLSFQEFDKRAEPSSQVATR